MADIDDMDDIEDLLEAPYKTLEKAMSVTTDERNQAEVCNFRNYPKS